MAYLVCGRHCERMWPCVSLTSKLFDACEGQGLLRVAARVASFFLFDSHMLISLTGFNKYSKQKQFRCYVNAKKGPLTRSSGGPLQNTPCALSTNGWIKLGGSATSLGAGLSFALLFSNARKTFGRSAGAVLLGRGVWNSIPVPCPLVVVG